VKLYYTHNLNPRLCVAAARHIGIGLDFERASPRDPRHEEAFRPLNPNTLCPLLVDGDYRLWETDAIVCYLSTAAGSGFWRQGRAQTEMIRWISWATHHLNQAVSPIYFDRIVMPTFTTDRLDPAEIAAAFKDWHKFMAILDNHMKERDFVADDALCYADFRVAAGLPFAEGAGLPLAEYPAVARWHGRLMQAPFWADPFAGLA